MSMMALSARMLCARRLLCIPASPLDLMCEAEMHIAIRAALESLTDRERNVIRWRFGFDGEARPRRPQGEGLTLEAVAERLGVTRSRVSQIESHALRVLRSSMLEYFDEKPNYYKTRPHDPGKSERARQVWVERRDAGQRHR